MCTEIMFNLDFRPYSNLILNLINYSLFSYKKYVHSNVFPKGSVTGCDSSLGGGWMIFNFRLFSPFYFLLIEFYHFFFHLLYSADMLCL